MIGNPEALNLSDMDGTGSPDDEPFALSAAAVKRALSGCGQLEAAIRKLKANEVAIPDMERLLRSCFALAYTVGAENALRALDEDEGDA